MLAFYISEATRSMFGDEKFNVSFISHGAVNLIELKKFDSDEDFNNYIKNNPLSPESKWNGYYNSLSINEEGKITSGKAEAILDKALYDLNSYLEPKILAANYFLKGKNDYIKALNIYIDLYFDNPHFYDWEFAEFRIKTISLENKKAWWETKKMSGAPIAKLIESENNPRIIGVAISEIRDNWNSEYLQVMLKLFRNDDPDIQRQALHTILHHPEDAPSKETIKKLLNDKDLIVRAMASFLVVKCLGEKHFNLLKDNLESGIELIQYDTMQALVVMGGKNGKEFLKKNPLKNAQPELEEMWQHVVYNK